MRSAESLTQIVGNSRARDGLLRAIDRGRLPHALLFHGPPGVGKRAVAQALARALLCSGDGPDACDECGPCRRTKGGTHPDLIVVEPDGQFVKVEATRAVVRTARLRPFEGRAKVCVFPHAEAFNDESANTLLKTLEEPPPSTYLILVTSNRDAVLALTLRSRCQALEFAPLRRSDLERHLTERDGLDSATARRVARHARLGDVEASSVDLAAIDAARAEATEVLLPLANARLELADAERIIKLAERLARKGADLDGFLLRGLRPARP